MKQPFKNKVIAITGGATGIGRAIGFQFGLNGACIGLLDQNEKEVMDTAQRMRNRSIQATGIHCDVTKEDNCHAAMATVNETFGGIDVLVNNAGITLREPFIRTQIVAYQKVMAVNFFGALNSTTAAMESLVFRKGMIIVISSIAGFSPLPGRSGYCASKYALHGLFDTLRIELENKGVHVLMVCPTFVKTNLQQGALGGNGELTTRKQSLLGQPETVEKTAQQIYRAAVKRKKLLIPTPMGQLAYWVSRLSPRAYDRIVSRKFKSELTC